MHEVMLLFRVFMHQPDIMLLPLSRITDLSRYTFKCINICESRQIYSLRSIILFANTDVSITKMCLDTTVLAKSNMGRRE
jgi:hypothetical protein